MLNQEQMRTSRFRGFAKTLRQQLQGKSEEEQENILTHAAYDLVIHTLTCGWKTFQAVMHQRLQESNDIYVDVPDLPQWPDSLVD